MRVLLALPLLLVGCGPVNPGGGGDPVIGAPDCTPDPDGVITAAESPFVPGVSATYVSSGDEAGLAFDPEPQVDEIGARTWDLSEGPDDARATLTLEEVAPGDWFIDAVPDAELHIASDVLRPGVHVLYAPTIDGLVAHGLASVDPEPAAEHTLLAYDAPLLVLPLPLQVGDRWGGQATFRDARLAGVPNAGVEDWSFEVVDRAEAVLPGGTRMKDVLAVRTEVRRTLAVASNQPGNTATTWQLQLMAPCAGELLTVSGSDEDLTVIDRMRRLLP